MRLIPNKYLVKDEKTINNTDKNFVLFKFYQYLWVCKERYLPVYELTDMKSMCYIFICEISESFDDLPKPTIEKPFAS